MSKPATTRMTAREAVDYLNVRGETELKRAASETTGLLDNWSAETRAEIQARAEAFVRDCFRIFGQEDDARNGDLVQHVAKLVMKAIP